MQPEIVNFVFPRNVLGQFIVNAHGCIELFSKDRAYFGLVDVDPKQLVVLLFVLFLKQLVEIVEIDDLYLADGLIQEMHEVLAPQHTTVRTAQPIVKYLPQLRHATHQINQTQLLKLPAKCAVRLEKAQHFGIYIVEVGVRGLQTNNWFFILNHSVTTFFTQSQLHIPHAPLRGEQWQFVEALEFEIFQKD